MFYVYILRCDDNSLYTGITTDVIRRFSEHVNGKTKGAKYTRLHKPVNIEAVWKTESRVDASKLEFGIKRLKKQQKEQLILEKISLCDVINNAGINSFCRIDISSL